MVLGLAAASCVGKPCIGLYGQMKELHILTTNVLVGSGDVLKVLCVCVCVCVLVCPHTRVDFH